MDFRLIVATVLTVYGIETPKINIKYTIHFYVATVLTVYGIETLGCGQQLLTRIISVATVLTVYGIETQ